MKYTQPFQFCYIIFIELNGFRVFLETYSNACNMSPERSPCAPLGQILAPWEHFWRRLFFGKLDKEEETLFNSTNTPS